MNKWIALVKEEQGQGLTEYGLVLGIIAVAVVGIIAAFRQELVNIFNDALGKVQNRDQVPAAGGN
ncbi:Flp family type IVb pilin [Paenibacillus thermotolerans]|uniref:Flp family type IVb pilin n=1 Tax=Paenibacillus thermotolerans TaxID=3027807 RepID=UPI003CC60176